MTLANHILDRLRDQIRLIELNLVVALGRDPRCKARAGGEQ